MEGYSEIAELRQAELRCAVEKLGVSDLHLLGYRDSGMIGTEGNQHPDALAQADSEQVTAQLVKHMRRIQPQVVITHDPGGGYGHPDHIVVHKTTVEAFHAAGDPGRYPEAGPPFSPQKLYYSIIPMRYMNALIWIGRLLGKDPTRWGRNQDIDLTEIVANQHPIDAEINFRRVADRKREATACHASQLDMGSSSRGLFGFLTQLVRRSNVETFSRAHPPERSGRTERDLFAGVA